MDVAKDRYGGQKDDHQYKTPPIVLTCRGRLVGSHSNWTTETAEQKNFSGPPIRQAAEN